MGESCSTNPKGFTLIEIIVAVSLVILAFSLLSIKIPAQKIIVENTANELASAIRYTRQLYEAGDKGVYFVISKESDGNHYKIIETKNRIKTVTLDKKIDDEVLISQKINIPEDHIPNNGNSGYTDVNQKIIEIKFSGNTATGTSILLKGKNSKEIYKITVIPTSSRIHLYKGI